MYLQKTLEYGIDIRYIDLEKNFSKNELIGLYKMQEEASQDESEESEKSEKDEYTDYWFGAKAGNMHVDESELIPKYIYIYIYMQ